MNRIARAARELAAGIATGTAIAVGAASMVVYLTALVALFTSPIWIPIGIVLLIAKGLFG